VVERDISNRKRYISDRNIERDVSERERRDCNTDWE